MKGLWKLWGGHIWNFQGQIISLVLFLLTKMSKYPCIC